MEVLLIGIVVIGALWFWGVANSDAFNQRLDKINRTTGYNFSRELYLGAPYGGFLFDNKNKKICFVQGKEHEILDYSYIRSWQLHWTERPGRGIGTYTNIYFAFATNDLARPIIKIKQHSKTYADEWNAKLGILFA